MENIDKELGVAFESIADENRRWIQMLKEMEPSLCLSCRYCGDKYCFPWPNDLPYLIDPKDRRKPPAKHWFCSCEASERYRQEITNERITECKNFKKERGVCMDVPHSNKKFICTRPKRTNRENEDEKAALAYAEIHWEFLLEKADWEFLLEEAVVCRVWLLGVAPSSFLIDWREPVFRESALVREKIEAIKEHLISFVKEQVGG